MSEMMGKLEPRPATLLDRRRLLRAFQRKWGSMGPRRANLSEPHPRMLFGPLSSLCCLSFRPSTRLHLKLEKVQAR
jgi:hypothetical protein